jgi:glycerol-3-phosphate acyltransferase PlsY
MNMEVYEFIRNIGLILLCYLIGAIPFCNVITKTHSNKVTRKIGDKNSGRLNLIFNINKSNSIFHSVDESANLCMSSFVCS